MTYISQNTLIINLLFYKGLFNIFKLENSPEITKNIFKSIKMNWNSEIKDKNILLIDDIYDSGATIREIGFYLTNLGAKCIAPLVIAKTVGGDIKC